MGRGKLMQTVNALFASYQGAAAAASALRAAGVPSSGIGIIANDVDSRGARIAAEAAVLGPEANAYAEVLRRGGALVTARVTDAQVRRTRELLLRYEPLDTVLPRQVASAGRCHGSKGRDHVCSAEQIAAKRIRDLRDRLQSLRF